MLDWIKKVVTSKSTATDPVWAALERLDPLLAQNRFESLTLDDQQRIKVKGLIDGSISPSEVHVVDEWSKETGGDDSGVEATVMALQHVLGGSAITYLFEHRSQIPVARFPHLVDEDSLTVLFNDRESHLQIASLNEFVSLNNIQKFTLEKLDETQLRARVTGRPLEPAGGTSARSVDQNATTKGPMTKITIERDTRDGELLLEPVEISEVVAALHEMGVEISADKVSLDEKIDKLGLYSVSLKFGPGDEAKAYLWVVQIGESL